MICNSSNYGPLLENMVFTHLRDNDNDVEYVNTKNGHETDFFVRNKIDGNVQLIQVCRDISDNATFERELRGLKSALACSLFMEDLSLFSADSGCDSG